MPPNTPSPDFSRRQAEADFDGSAPGQSAREASAPSELPQALAEAEGEIVALQARNTELAEQSLRAQADLQNARRRADEEVAKARKFAIESFAESMLPVADSLEASLAIAEATSAQIREGAEATLRQLKSALELNKVVEVAPATGSRFDPHLHQAISVVFVNQPANTVVELLQKGYTISGRVLRPALVTVATSH